VAAQYLIRLMFEWGGGCLWSGNDAARERFDVGAIEGRLPLSPQTRKQLKDLSEWHDKSLNWDYPPDPGPWTKEQKEAFEAAARDALVQVRSELGPDYDVVYKPL
jgi:hypothetical protein